MNIPEEEEQKMNDIPETKYRSTLENGKYSERQNTVDLQPSSQNSSNQNVENIISMWKNFDWQEQKQGLPLDNLFSIINLISYYIVENKITEAQMSEEIVEIMCKEGWFQGSFKTSNNLVVENLNDTYMHRIFHTYIWEQIKIKNTTIPAFNVAACLLFGSQQQPTLQQPQ